jgi:hypothetical protein
MLSSSISTIAMSGTTGREENDNSWSYTMRSSPAVACLMTASTTIRIVKKPIVNHSIR